MPLTIVTGGSRGIGAATCRRLAADGHDVVVAYAAAGDAAEAVAADVRAAGRRCATVAVDVSDSRDVDRLFDAAAELGAVTGLVNNAAITGPVGPLADASPDGLRRMLEVDVLGVLLCARRAARDLGADGAIVNVSSIAASTGAPGEYVGYAGAKAAVDAITVGLARELAPVRVNAVAPGTTWTDIHADPERPAKVAARIPAGRAAQPEEVAAAIAWLLSPDASYTSGAVLRVTGGA